MNEQQMKWASQHDWYIGHGVNVDNVLFVRVRGDIGDVAWTRDFTDYQALRAWAGY